MPNPTTIKVGNRAALLSRWQSLSFATRVILGLSAVFALSYMVLGNRVLLGSFATLELDSTLRAALVTRYDQANVIPLTMVAIDDATAAPPTPDAQTWGFTNTTPHDKLSELIRQIAAAAPAAIVVDVDLADVEGANAKNAATKDEVLSSYLQSYSGPPLIFIRSAVADADGQIKPTVSSTFDPILAANPHLSWAHALYGTDPDGTVRHWNEWFVACGPAGATALPAAALRILANWGTADPFPRPSPPTLREPCEAGITQSRSHIIIYDAGLYPGQDAAVSRSLSIISAWQVTDARVKRDDAKLFSGRAVLIGGTRTGSNDLWRTPVGMLPGVELMANTVRFAPGQVRESAHGTLFAVLFFVLFCALKLLLRPIVAIAAGIALCGGVLWLFGPYATLDAIQAALVLFVELSLIEECIHLCMDAREYGWRFFVAPHLRSRSS